MKLLVLSLTILSACNAEYNYHGTPGYGNDSPVCPLQPPVYITKTVHGQCDHHAQSTRYITNTQTVTVPDRQPGEERLIYVTRTVPIPTYRTVTVPVEVPGYGQTYTSTIVQPSPVPVPSTYTETVRQTVPIGGQPNIQTRYITVQGDPVIRYSTIYAEKQVPGPGQTYTETRTINVNGPQRTEYSVSTVIQTIPGPAQTIPVEVPGPTEYKTTVVQVPGRDDIRVETIRSTQVVPQVQYSTITVPRDVPVPTYITQTQTETKTNFVGGGVSTVYDTQVIPGPTVTVPGYCDNQKLVSTVTVPDYQYKYVTQTETSTVERHGQDQVRTQYVTETVRAPSGGGRVTETKMVVVPTVIYSNCENKNEYLPPCRPANGNHL